MFRPAENPDSCYIKAGLTKRVLGPVLCESLYLAPTPWLESVSTPDDHKERAGGSLSDHALGEAAAVEYRILPPRPPPPPRTGRGPALDSGRASPPRRNPARSYRVGG